MRIGIVAPPWAPVPPVVQGGKELLIDTLARGLSVAGLDVALFATSDSSCPVSTEFVVSSVDVSEVGVMSAGVEMRHVIAAYEALAGEVDVICDHTTIGPAYGAKVADVPLVAVCHEPVGPSNVDILTSAQKAGATLVAVSDSQAQEFAGVRFDSVIHHGLDTGRFPDGVGEGEYLCFLGEMTARGGAHLAIRVAREAGFPLQIAVAPTSSFDREYFESEIKPILGDRIEFVGDITPSQRLKLISSARALIYPIRFDEPFGLPMIESMACGTPVIVSDRASAREVVAHGLTGYVCEGIDEMIVAASKVGQISRRACRFEVETHFSMRRMTSEYLALFGDLTTNRPVRDVGHGRPATVTSRLKGSGSRLSLSR